MRKIDGIEKGNLSTASGSRGETKKERRNGDLNNFTSACTQSYLYTYEVVQSQVLLNSLLQITSTPLPPKQPPSHVHASPVSFQLSSFYSPWNAATDWRSSIKFGSQFLLQFFSWASCTVCSALLADNWELTGIIIVIPNNRNSTVAVVWRLQLQFNLHYKPYNILVSYPNKHKLPQATFSVWFNRNKLIEAFWTLLKRLQYRHKAIQFERISTGHKCGGLSKINQCVKIRLQ